MTFLSYQGGKLKNIFQDIPKQLIILGFVGFGSIAITCLVYFFNFHGNLLDEQEKWGTFGDFIGGTTSPLLGFLTFIGVLWTIQISRKQTELMKIEAEKNEIKQKKDDVYKLIETIYNDITNKLSTTEIELITEPISVLHGSFSKQVSIKTFICSPASVKIYMDLPSKYKDLIRTELSELSILVNGLKKYCLMYENYEGSDNITYFFKIHFFYLIQFLYDAKELNDEDYNYFHNGVKTISSENTILSNRVDVEAGLCLE